MTLAEVLDILEYSQSPFYRRTVEQQKPELNSLFRAAKEASVQGIYVFQTSSSESGQLSERPAVFVAEARTTDEAHIIHHRIWNTGQAPFLIIVLPTHIRVYTGFDFSIQNKDAGVVESKINLDRNAILEHLADFCAMSIDTGELWRKRSKHLKPQRRVDRRLLDNLSKLGNFLREEMNLPSKVAHALIGKYIYIRYLRDRDILSDRWLEQNNSNINDVLGRNATVEGLRNLCTILEKHFNGNIFPINFDDKKVALSDEHVALVASVFIGDRLLTRGVRQLSFDFKVYDFAYIPIELLSSIYEQFLHIEGKEKKIGAYYTPEYLADYLIEEMNVAKPLREGMKILDPSCGSGIFLVLIYAHLIEMRLASSGRRTLPLIELLALLENIYGVERELDACYVAEFSLILTLLHYANVTEFLHDEQFKLPSLHNTHIFCCDFFDNKSRFHRKSMHFDWIIGNPPWIAANRRDETPAYTWIDLNKRKYPIDNKSIAEAFSWHMLDLLSPEGYVGLILPAALLFNLAARKYRKQFFDLCKVYRITNFANLRGELFEGRAIAPAITMIYQQTSSGQEKPQIEHYGPFSINQITKSRGKLWVITINENEYQTVSPYEAANGDTSTWKYALWGTHRDRRAIARLRRLFPKTLAQLCKENEHNNWYLHEGPQLRSTSDTYKDDLDPEPQLVGKERLDTDLQNNSGLLFSIASRALEKIPEEECNIRVKGGRKGLLIANPPHVVMSASWKYAIYSDKYFVIKPRQIGLSAPQEHESILRALSVFLSSDIVRYYLFFQTPSYGIERDRITLNDVKSIPVPIFTAEQIEKLAEVQKHLEHIETEYRSLQTQRYVNEQVIQILNVPDSISALITEFIGLRLKLINERVDSAVQPPHESDLQRYAYQLTKDLDGFITSGNLHHRVTVEKSPDLIGCTIEFIKSKDSFTPVIRDVTAQNGHTFRKLQQGLTQEFSQWVYVQRGLSIFTDNTLSLYKTPQLINWTLTQAMNDADDIIAEVVSYVCS